MGRSTAAEAALRVSEVARLMARGYSRHEICGYARGKWGVSESQADRYASDARDLMAEALSDDMDGYAADVKARYRYLYKEAVKAGNLALAERVLTHEWNAFRGYEDPSEGMNARLASLMGAGFS